MENKLDKEISEETVDKNYDFYFAKMETYYHKKILRKDLMRGILDSQKTLNLD